MEEAETMVEKLSCKPSLQTFIRALIRPATQWSSLAPERVAGFSTFVGEL
jgi:hypothetical protein